MKKTVLKAILLYFLMWVLWSAYRAFVLPHFPQSILFEIVDGVVVKALVWVVPFIFFAELLKPKTLFGAPFPWLPCLILLCASTAFLFTVRLLNGLQNTHVIFDRMMIVLSLSAGVLEELSFRGGFFAMTEDRLGFWGAALLNGAMFTLYHYPELLLGQWQGLISLRSILIFVMGVLFCWTYRKWRNLALNMVVHTYWDILSFLFCLTG
ncbi:MAG: CPBP family intramembrane metalloprotease [Ruminococcus sp.]|nr:CPBP family intramembrane metalloprotease [Ruminococcus sp.]